MRVILTLIAVALVTFLTAALVAPYLVDWSAHRADVAARLAALTGGRVALDGPVTLRLLPTPYLEVGAGSAAGPGEGAPRLTFAGARLELALVKLASGAFRFTEVRLDKPVLTLARAADGALVLPGAGSAPAEAVGFDRVAVRDGTIRIAAGRGAPEFTIRDVDVDGDAASLAGPYHVSGSVAGPGGAPLAFRLATEKAGADGAPIRLGIERGPGWPALEFDGTLAFRAHGPSALGAAVLSGAAPDVDGPIPWRAAGALAADLDGASLTGAEFRFGQEERALRAEGSAGLAFGAPARLTIRAEAKQANLDALLRRKGEDGVAPARAIERLSAALAPALAAAGPATLDGRFAVATAILGGDAVTGLTAAVEARPGDPMTVRFEAGLPGTTRLKAEGRADIGVAPTFAGAIDFATEDAGVVGTWAGQGAPDFAPWAQALGDAMSGSRFAASGTIEATAAGVSGQGLRIELGRSTLTGALAVTRPAGGAPGRIQADLATDSLDIDALPSLEAARALIGGYDLSLALEARALSVAHLGGAGIAGASLSLKIGKAGPTTTLDRLTIGGLGGAALEATGVFGPEGISARGRLNADRLGDFAALIARLAPGPFTRALVDRASSLSPASIDFEAVGGPSAAAEAPVLRTLKASGAVAGTRLALEVEPQGDADRRAITLGLEARDSAALLRQIGFGAAAAGGGAHVGAAHVDAAHVDAAHVDAAHVDLHASGAWEAGYDVDGSARVAGAAVAWRGRYAPAAEGDAASLFGALKVEAANIAPLAALLGLAPPGPTLGPVEAAADVTRRADRWTVSRISAAVAGVRAAGSLVYERPGEGARTLAGPDLARAEDAVAGPASPTQAEPAAVTGALSFDRLRLADLAALALGPAQPARAPAIWSTAGFPAPPLTLPSAAVRLSAATLGLSEGLAARGFSTSLRLDGGRLDLDDVAMTVGGGVVSGRATLRRSGDNATLEGALSAEPLALTRPGLSGRVGGRLDFASTGRSPAALVAGLAGGGEVMLSGAALPRSDPAALDRVIAAAEVDGAEIDETNVAYQFGAALDKGALAIPSGATPIALSAGTIRLGPLAFAAGRVQAALTATFALSDLALETRLGLSEPATGLKFWTGPPPAASVTVSDATGAPKRRLDVAALAAGLATQAIGRESDRIANLEADIRERAFFNRRLKGERFLDRRAAEIEDWRAEQERLNGLAQRLAAQRAEEERLAAEKAAAEKAAAEKAAAEKAAADRAAADKAAAEKAAAEKAAADKAAAEKAAAGKAAADEKAAAEKAAADKAALEAAGRLLGAAPEGSAGSPPEPGGAAGSKADGSETPLPPARPKPKAAPSAPDPAASGLY
ncbi:hypothetical protein DFR50_101333 [Roseiarcus fermentans]|uniref:AsmA-like protein n=1 Tax=Roseiarcus fermentans TaxID=1473586 RepID=A0A366FXC1_9HYPH|nr:hypothetical protein [Roseiarcus fermentans]RBP18385.1 hypothetical protein DFR50_101333 [Roseiarcus fermentans]